MFDTKTSRKFHFLPLLVCVAVSVFTVSSFGQETVANSVKKAPSAVTAAVAKSAAPLAGQPVYAGYKGVRIGTTSVETRKLLGEPRDKADAGDYYVFSDNETVQVMYDSAGTVRVISINYIGKSSGAPTVKDVLGEMVEPRPDGSLFKLVRYPKAGSFVSYNKTTGDNPMVIITWQKTQVEQ
jgi:hypothetical protein